VLTTAQNTGRPVVIYAPHTVALDITFPVTQRGNGDLAVPIVLVSSFSLENSLARSSSVMILDSSRCFESCLVDSS
jgi:hypothetical protein